MKKDIITLEDLTSLLSYDKDTGHFYWKVRRGKAQAGQQAGCVEYHGYVTIRLYGKNYKAHRLAWLYVYGEWPEDQVDHINRIRTDNRINNLRAASHTENARNSINTRKKSGLPRGVVKDSREGWYRVFIRHNKKQLFLGCYADPDEAHEVYKQAAIRYHGEFKRFD